MRFILILMILAAHLSLSQNLNIGHTTITFNDPTRSGGFGSGGGVGRQIQTEIYYPANTNGENVALANGQWPIIVFGHGFAMNWDAYSNIWNYLVPYGYVMAFPRTESSLFPAPNHLDFGLDLAVVGEQLFAVGQNSSSLFYSKLSEYACVMGHSMGGGAAVLAASQSAVFDCYLGLAPAETNPSAISAAVSLQIPTLILSGSNDGVTPPSQHHLPIYDAIPVECKSFANLIGGGHCYFANTNFNCDFGESASSTGISLSRSEQQNLMYQQIAPWLSYFLNRSCEGFESFIAYPINGISLNSTCPNDLQSVTIIQNGNTLSTSTQGVAYQWFLNNQAIAGATNNSIQVPNNFAGVYQLLVYFDYGCQYSNNILQVNELNPTFSVFPNPASNQIEVEDISCINCNYDIFNLQGQIVQSGMLLPENMNIPCHELSAGTYFLEFNTRTVKLLIER
jgi:predicted dienelactone hydrolase